MNVNTIAQARFFSALGPSDSARCLWEGRPTACGNSRASAIVLFAGLPLGSDAGQWAMVERAPAYPPAQIFPVRAGVDQVKTPDPLDDLGGDGRMLASHGEDEELSVLLDGRTP